MQLSLKQVGANQTELSVGLCTLFFSYQTCVAACVAGKGFLVSEKYYSRTTSKHVAKWVAGRTATTVPQATIDKLCVLNPNR